jgi:predicted Zn-dependent peptidase
VDRLKPADTHRHTNLRDFRNTATVEPSVFENPPAAEHLFRLPRIEFSKSTLPNGLDVIVLRRPELPLVAINLWYHVGSKNEERRQRGFAHLFEHLMFEGSEHFPGDFFKPLQRLGASINGSTSSDRTNYFVDLPSAHLELALAMESDRMGHFLPALTEHKLRIQKDVVKNEYRQNYANRSYGQAWGILSEAMYPPDHPYNWLTIGVMEDVEAATRDDVESFFQRYYVPSNASLCVAGDVHEEEALDLARRYFGSIAGGASAAAPRVPAASLPSPVRLTLHDRVELDRSYRAWHTVPHFGQDDALLTLIADILARGKCSRLYQSLVVRQRVAQDATAYQSGRELAGAFGIVVTARPGVELARAAALVDAQIEDLARNGPTDEELERAKNQRVAGFVYSLDDLGGFGGVADRLNAYNTYLGDPARLQTDLSRFLSATPEKLKNAVEQYLCERPSATLEVVGRSHALVLPPLDRRVAPPSKPAVPYRAPVPEPIHLANGSELWLLPRPGLPIVAATFVASAGASVHSPAQGGLANLTAAMMTEGTSSRSSEQLAREAERLGTLLSSSAGWDGSYIGLQCLSHYTERSVELAVDILRNPTFPEDDWSRIRGQTLAALQAEVDSPEAQAYRGLLSALYEPEDPYVVPAEGTVGSVESLDRADLRAFHASAWPRRTAWIVAGAIDQDTARALFEPRLGGWGAPAQSDAIESALVPPRLHASRLIVVDRPGAPQAVVRMGQVGVSRLHPDHDALLLWNQILGGQFSSRLNARLREEKGLTYGIRSHFDSRRGAGPFWVGSSLQSDRIAEALVDIRSEIEALLADRPPTEAELQDARRALIEGQSRHFETPSALVARYGGLFLHGLPPDHHARLPERLAALSSKAVAEAALRNVHPDAMAIVVVADAGAVSASLEALDWGPVERRPPSA